MQEPSYNKVRVQKKNIAQENLLYLKCLRQMDHIICHRWINLYPISSLLFSNFHLYSRMVYKVNEGRLHEMVSTSECGVMDVVVH